MSDSSPRTGAPTPPRGSFHPLVYLGGGIAISLAPLVVLWLGGAEAIRDFFFWVSESLGKIQPFNFVPVYLDQWRACDYLAQIDEYNCSSARYYNPMRLVGALISTVGVIWTTTEGSVTFGLIMTLVLGFYFSISLARRLLGGEVHVATVILAAAAAPFLTSAAIFVLQWVAIGLSLLIAYTIVALLWAAGAFRATWQVYKTAREAQENARMLKEMHARMAGSPPDPPNA